MIGVLGVPALFTLQIMYNEPIRQELSLTKEFSHMNQHKRIAINEKAKRNLRLLAEDYGMGGR